MSKENDEKVVKEIIEYATGEITKSKKKNTKILISILASLILLVTTLFFVFIFEIPVSYNEDLIETNVPIDKGLDIKINISNYKNAKAVLVKVDENTYDLYINITQTLATKLIDDNDKTNNILRAGNGMVADFQANIIRAYLPEGYTVESIMNVYYIDNLSNRLMVMDDTELIKYENKILIWTRK